MTNAELIKALRYCGNFADREGCDEKCPYFNDKDCPKRIMCDAADAIERMNNLLDLNTQRCEALRGQLRDSNESYEKHLNEIESQVPRWIPVTERLPERADEVLIAYREEYDELANDCLQVASWLRELKEVKKNNGE